MLVPVELHPHTGGVEELLESRLQDGLQVGVGHRRGRSKAAFAGRLCTAGLGGRGKQKHHPALVVGTVVGCHLSVPGVPTAPKEFSCAHHACK